MHFPAHPDEAREDASRGASGLQSARRMLKHSRVPVFLLLLSLIPHTGFAARAGSEAFPPGSQEPSALSLLGGELPAPPRPSRGVRILAEVGASLLTGAVAGAVGFLTGDQLCRLGLVDTRTGWFPCLTASTTGLLVGVGVGLPLGVFWGGETARGDARLVGTLGGYAGGLLTAGLVGWVVSMTQDPSSTLGSRASWVLAGPLGLAGAILGYELTERGDVTHRVQPLVSVSSRGALLGLRGTF